jgi:hypothetical protein
MRRAWLALIVPLALAGACIATAPGGIQRETDGGGGNLDATSDASSSISSATGSNDPHAVLGTDPPHGPFNGGQRVIVQGNGFTSDVRVWFGGSEATEVIAIDPTRIQVNAPPGDPGAVDVTAQNGDDASTKRTLPGGYTYDALYAEPNSGPVSGGVVINIFGKNTTWDQDLIEARVDNKPCTSFTVISATELTCMVPKGTPGTKSIAAFTSQGTTTALDAFTYSDSDNGFKGGLSGGTLAGKLKVLAYDNFTGTPLEGAHVIAGENLATALYQQADASGVTVFDDPSLNVPVTVTVAAYCHSPITFVDVPVDTVTVYLNPVLSPLCASDGDPPTTGGSPVLTGLAEGELVWPGTQEFQKGVWSNVPGPQGPHEERIAYVFFGNREPGDDFDPQLAADTVTEDDPGDLGYGFSSTYFPGNFAIYAVAGIRNKATGVFYGYSFGAVKGVALSPGNVTDSIYINMDHAMDQALTMNATPPAPGSKGPDRLHATVAIEIAHQSYAILPGMQKTPLIPLSGSLNFVGLPGLDGGLTGMRYLSTGRAVTGPSLDAPLAVVGNVATTTTSVPVLIDGFVAMPQLDTPLLGGGWDGAHLAVSYAQGGFPADVTVYEILSGDGLWRWVVAVPEAAHSIEVPDLSGFPDAHLPGGPIVIGVYGARIDEFDYGKITYRQLRPQGMSAYSLDFFNAYL